jgi:adenylate kinase
MKEEDFWRKTEKIIENVKKDKEEVDFNNMERFPTRKFLLLNIMPILTKGMLEVCKINPIDPIDYLADFLFKNSTD